MTTMTPAGGATTQAVLDPCLLGRPVHLLHVFAAQLRDDLETSLRQPAHRRYWGAMQVGQVAFSRIESQAPQGRWLDFAGPQGTIGLNLERKILLAILNHRYGRKNAAPAAGATAAGAAAAAAAAAADASADADADGAHDAAPAAPAAPPPRPAAPTSSVAPRVTATEERLAVLLARQLAQTLAARVALNLAAISAPDSDGARAAPALAASASVPGEVAADDDTPLVPGAAPLKGGWVIRVALSDAQAGLDGELWFALDKRMMGDVLRGLLPRRTRSKKSRDPRPLAAQLQLTLEGRLITKQMLLGSLFDLRVGDVIPVSMSRTDVLLDDSRLFTAAVSEFKGKLCLTSFEDAE